MSSCSRNKEWTQKSYDVETLRSRVSNLGLERRPVQHPAGNENGLSEQPRSLDEACTLDNPNNVELSELGDEDESFVIDSFHSDASSISSHAAMVNYGGMPPQPYCPSHRVGTENHVNNVGLPANPHQQKRAMLEHQPYRNSPRTTEHHPLQHVPQSPNYHHYQQESRLLLVHPNRSNQAGPYLRTEYAPPGFPNQHPNPGKIYSQQAHLEIGFLSVTPDIGFQESLQDIAPPAPVPTRRVDHVPPVCLPDYSRQSSSPEYSRQVSGPDCNCLDVKPEYHHQDSKESVGSDYSFTTMHPSYEDRSPVERSDERKCDYQLAPIPTVSNQVSRAQTPGRTTSTQPYNSPGPTQPYNSPGPTQPYNSPGPTQPYNGAGPTHPRAPPLLPTIPLERVKVFITYATEQDNPNHARTVVQISQTLLRNSIDVGVDVLEENLLSMSSSEWLDNSISNSDFVLICVSPAYREVVEGQSTSGQSGYHHKERAIHTQYIYRRIHAEYIGNGSKNLRFIPVLVSGAELKHIPPWLRDTRVFEWPDNYQDIIFRLFRKERFVKPKPGPAPKHTVERFSNYNERHNSRSSDRSDDHPTEPRKA